MARTPRRNMKDSSFFHIMVQGLNKEFIFNTKGNMKKYHDYIYINSENIDILAYCIMNNHAHFLVYSEKIENIENWMKKSNTSYALYYNKIHNRVGYVFRSRYKSQIIDNEKYLYTCIKYIHENPIKAGICRKLEEYKFSSFVEIYECKESEVFSKISKYLKNKDLSQINVLEDDFRFIENEKIDKKYLCEKIIKDFLNSKSIKIRDLRFEKDYLEELVKILKVKNQISYREIERNIGINKESLRKILNK